MKEEKNIKKFSGLIRSFEALLRTLSIDELDEMKDVINSFETLRYNRHKVTLWGGEIKSYIIDEEKMQEYKKIMELIKWN